MIIFIQVNKVQEENWQLMVDYSIKKGDWVILNTVKINSQPQWIHNDNGIQHAVEVFCIIKKNDQ